MTNYAKLGEYIAYKRQFEDAATRRRDILAMLENRELTARMSAETRINSDEFIPLVKDAVRADIKIRAALDIANKAAPRCGESEILLNQHHHSVICR